MVASVVPAVIIGLVAGSVFVAAFGLSFYPSGDRVLINNIPELPAKGNNLLIVKILQKNATVADLLRGHNVTLIHISERSMAQNCSFGSCARVILQSEDGYYLTIWVDFTNHKVAQIYFGDWRNS